MLYDMNISVFDIIKITDTKICRIQSLPLFYCGVFSGFYFCKKRRNIVLKKETEFCQNLYGVIYSLYLKEKIICFENWIKDGILYVKDIFDEKEEMNDISHFMNILGKRNNILCNVM